MRDIAFHILDIAQNTVSSGANLLNIQVPEKICSEQLFVRIRDHGQRMDQEMMTENLEEFVYTA